MSLAAPARWIALTRVLVVGGSLLVSGGLLAGGAALARAADTDDEMGAVVLVFPRDAADPNGAIRVERDLRNMYAYARQEGKPVPRILPVELRYDVGNLSKGEISKARVHFNDAQRALEAGDADEAKEQLFRAERFYKKAIPYASDHPLLRGIFFYYYLARQAAGLADEARENYCAYVALTRNLAGSAGPLEQFEPLADKCGDTKIAGTGELRVTADVDGAHVYVDNRAVGVIGRQIPYVDPFAPAGPHLVEVRKAGYARWGTLVTLFQGKSESLRAQLKKARNRAEEYTPLAGLVFEGDEALSEEYLADLFFQMADRFHARELVCGYLRALPGNRYVLTLFRFDAEHGMDRQEYSFGAELDGHRPALMQYWRARFGEVLDPEDAVPSADRFAPTLFKVE